MERVNIPLTPPTAALWTGGHQEALPNLIPESNLPSIPARHPCGEQSFYISQEDHSVYAVVLVTGLLVGEAHNDRVELQCEMQLQKTNTLDVTFVSNDSASNKNDVNITFLKTQRGR